MVKNKMVTEKEADYLFPDWHEQVTEIARAVWTSDKVNYRFFPHPPFARSSWWKNEATVGWATGTMLSRFWVNEDGVITATASLVNKGNYWELGRFHSLDSNPRGTMQTLASDLYRIASQAGYRVVCEATQRHTSSQYIAGQVLKMRFAGYGFLAKKKKVSWDILYFDNYPADDFISDREGLINNLLGVPGMATQENRKRLAVVRTILSTERSSGFPPQKFHIYDKYLENFKSILRMNVDPTIV